MNNKFKKGIGLLLVLLTGFTLTSCGSKDKDPEMPIDGDMVTVTYDSDNGTHNIAQRLPKGNKTTRITDPTKDNYDFLGWYNNDTLYDFELAVESDLYLKAKWERYTELEQTFGLSGTPAKIKFYYNDSYLSNDSDKFSKDLAIFSFGSALASENKTINNKYFSNLGFDTITYYGDVESEYENVCYSIQHKTISETDLIVVSVRGVGYETEWVNNFDLGLSGNHHDFDERASKILTKLNTYITANKTKANLKLLITGYSRGAAIANILSDKLLKLDTKVTPDKNLYSYSFATPKGIEKDTETAYPNVFNIVNEADLITHFAPTKYGFERCGTDVDIYSSKIDEYVKAFDSSYELPAFKEMSGMFTKETEIPEYIIDKLTNYDTSDPTTAQYTLNTRQEFVERYEEHIGFILSNYFTIKEITKANIITEISKIAKENAFQLLYLIQSGDNLYNFLKPFIQEDKGSSYDTEFDTKFLNACTAVINIVKTSGASLLIFGLDPYNKVILRTIYMHTSLMYYILLSNYTDQA